MKIMHIAAMELFTIYILWNVIRMWLKKPPIKYKIIRLLAFLLGGAGIVAGIYLFVHYYHFHSPLWLQVKFFLIVVFFIIGAYREHEAKQMVASGLLFFECECNCNCKS